MRVSDLRGSEFDIVVFSGTMKRYAYKITPSFKDLYIFFSNESARKLVHAAKIYNKIVNNGLRGEELESMFTLLISQNCSSYIITHRPPGCARRTWIADLTEHDLRVSIIQQWRENKSRRH